MKRKLFKQIRSQWRSNVWLVVEFVIILVVTWFMVDLICQITVPMTEPRGYEIDNCYKISITTPDEFPEELPMAYSEMKLELLSRLRSYPGVEGVAVSFGGMEPYSPNMTTTDLRDVTTGDTVSYGKDSDEGRIRAGFVNPGFFRVFRITGPRGETPDEIARRMFNLTGEGKFVVSPGFANTIDDGRPAPDPYSLIGHRFLQGRNELELAALINNVKRDDTYPDSHYNIMMLPFRDDDLDNMPFIDEGTDITIRVNPEAVKGFEERFRKDMGTLFRFPVVYVSNIVSYDKVRESRLADKLNGVRKMYLVIGFLMINIFLGLLGTFWYRTRQRTSELAVRMSFGAPRSSLFRRLIGEGIILLTVAAVIAGGIIALLISVEVRPEITYMSMIDSTWLIRDSIITFLLMLVMIFLGILIPARMAMRINPSRALHDE